MNASVDEPKQVPDVVADFAKQAMESVERSVGVALDFGGDTLPLLDHYLREVPAEKTETRALIASMAGAYFGEVVRRNLGGSWKIDSEDPAAWRLVLPGGLSFSPVRLALGAILKEDETEGNPDFAAPAMLMVHLDDALARMAPMTEREYYALSCRFDTLEHLQDVLLAIAADLAKKQNA